MKVSVIGIHVYNPYSDKELEYQINIHVLLKKCNTVCNPIGLEFPPFHSLLPSPSSFTPFSAMTARE